MRKKLKGKYTQEELQQLADISERIIAFMNENRNVLSTMKYTQGLNKLNMERNKILYSKDGGYREEWKEYEQNGTPESITKLFGFLARIGGERR